MKKQMRAAYDVRLLTQLLLLVVAVDVPAAAAVDVAIIERLCCKVRREGVPVPGEKTVYY